jgi:EAL domain-containing protein (putative c-di-GMP-specific phosphodiesterase class I)
VVAEGIESEQIWRYLCERGCHEAQGYFICKPLSGKNLSAWVRENGLHDKPWKPPARRDES